MRLKIARLHAKMTDCRMDATHKASRTLINENQVVCVETFTVKNMMKNPKLAKHIADANWGGFVRQLKYKSEWADRTPSRLRHKRSKEHQNRGTGGVVERLERGVRSAA